MKKQYYYIATDKNGGCKYSFQNIKVGETYKPNSFYFYENLEDSISNYREYTDRHFLIEIIGSKPKNNKMLKLKKVTILREINRDEIEEYIKDKKSFKAKQFLATFTNSETLLKSLSKEKHYLIRCAVAENKNTPAHILEELAKDKEWIVRLAVFWNPNTPVYLIEEKSKSKNDYIREIVANIPFTPVYILKELAKDEIGVIRTAVAENPNTPIYILEELVKDEYWLVRRAVATNLNTTVYLLEQLSKDKHLDVSKKAQERLKEITQ